jgi:hypothetical protein
LNQDVIQQYKLKIRSWIVTKTDLQIHRKAQGKSVYAQIICDADTTNDAVDDTLTKSLVINCFFDGSAEVPLTECQE